VESRSLATELGQADPSRSIADDLRGETSSIKLWPAAPIDGYRVPEHWNGRSFLAALPSAEYGRRFGGIAPTRVRRYVRVIACAVGVVSSRYDRVR
jgi:hypothetical protein